MDPAETPSQWLRHSVVRRAKAALTRARVVSWDMRSHAELEGLRVLLYHRISTDNDALALRPDQFQRQMEHLAAEGYRATDVVTALDELFAGKIEDRLVGITFDDGFRDVNDNAFPILEGLGFSASVFVATSVIDGTAKYAWASGDAPMLDWDEITRLDATGLLRFESHSLTHPDLRQLSAEECRYEITKSKEVLEGRLGRPTSAFCYPGGFLGARERDLVRDAGFRYAITCEPGINSQSVDPYLIRRIQVDTTDTLNDFAAKIRGSHDRPLLGRRQYRRLRYGTYE